jgi:hypothetical protein
VLDELTAARRAVEETTGQIEEAERARDAITIDAADVLARAEAEATSMLERANRDAEAIRQEAALATGPGIGPTDYGRAGTGATFADDMVADIFGRIERLERKLAKQRRRLDRMSRSERRGVAEAEAEAAADRPKSSKASAVEELARLVTIARPDTPQLRPLASVSTVDPNAAAVIASAEREAEEIRRAAHLERELFRSELVALLGRLTPIAPDSEVTDDEDDDDEW